MSGFFGTGVLVSMQSNKKEEQKFIELLKKNPIFFCLKNVIEIQGRPSIDGPHCIFVCLSFWHYSCNQAKKRNLEVQWIVKPAVLLDYFQHLNIFFCLNNMIKIQGGPSIYGPHCIFYTNLVLSIFEERDTKIHSSWHC